MTRRWAAAIVLLATLASAGCRDAPAALGPTPAVARAHADDLFRGLGLRFVNVRREPRFAAARGKLGQRALSPSKLIGDTSIWTGAPNAATRVLELDGRSTPSGYLFASRAGVPLPVRPGDARHTIRLARIGEDEYQWATLVEHAIGGVPPAAVASAFSAWLTTFQRSERELRADLATGLPRTSAALGRLFVLDSVRTTTLTDGSTVVDLRIRTDAKLVRPTMPALADYVDKYVTPARLVFQLGDGRGARWLDARMQKGILAVRFRTQNGRLLAVDGPARAMPDTAQIYVEAYERFLVFDVGVSEMVGEFAQMRTARARGWSMRFRRAPRWHLPFAVRHLIAGPLDRPFQGSGIVFMVGVRDDGPQTLLVRQLDVAVKESAIVRWLGGLGGRAMDDFAGRAEVEENRFTADALLALRADLVAALGGT